MLGYRTVIASLVMAGIASLAFAQTDAPIDKPGIKVGDTWTYRRVNLHTNALMETVADRVTFAERDVIHVVTAVTSSREEGDNTFTADWNMVMSRLRGGMIATPHTGTFNFPLQVGKTYPANYVFELTRAGRRLQHTRTAKVVGWEQVVVPAGSFRALKIEIKGTSQRLDAPGSGWTHTVVWYVPEVKRWAKVFSEDAAGNKMGEELLIFEVQ